MKIAATLIVLCLSLIACGQKGPLYLPQQNKPQPEVVNPKRTAPTAQPASSAPQQVREAAPVKPE